MKTHSFLIEAAKELFAMQFEVISMFFIKGPFYLP